jgi:hypothetical protein
MAVPIHSHPWLPSEIMPVPWATVTAAMARKKGPVRKQWVRPQRVALATHATTDLSQSPDLNRQAKPWPDALRRMQSAWRSRAAGR